GYAPPGTEDKAHIAIARANLEMLLRTLEKMGYHSDKAKQDRVIIRFGHATHATPDQLKRMAKLGVIAEANIGSNLATGSIKEVDDPPLLYNLYYEVPTILSTDGHGVMSTNMTAEYGRAENMIKDFKDGKTTINVRGGPKRYDKLTPDEKARF